VVSAEAGHRAILSATETGTRWKAPGKPERGKAGTLSSSPPSPALRPRSASSPRGIVAVDSGWFLWRERQTRRQVAPAVNGEARIDSRPCLSPFSLPPPSLSPALSRSIGVALRDFFNNASKHSPAARAVSRGAKHLSTFAPENVAATPRECHDSRLFALSITALMSIFLRRARASNPSNPQVCELDRLADVAACQS